MDLRHENFRKEDCNLWKLQPQLTKDQQTYKFVVSLKYGERQPRLLPNIAKPPKYSKLLASTNLQDGYYTDSYSLWKIRRHQSATSDSIF